VIKSEKKSGELAAALKNSNIPVVIEAIKALRVNESFEGAIGLLAAFYDSTDNKSVQKTIEEFFNDIKDQSARPEIIAEIRRKWKGSTTSMLVASCWQSGLRYPDYLSDFAKVFLVGDYATSIECMTVIEELVQLCSRDAKDEIIRLINESPLSYSNEKEMLTKELILILER
jgi:hypothetical protein